MRKADIEIGGTYEARVSARLVPVRILEPSPLGGWRALNTLTNREIRIKTAAKLRRPVPA